MTRGKILRTIILLSALIALPASAARADEMRVVTSGFVASFGPSIPGRFLFVGDDFLVEGGLSGGNTSIGNIFPVGTPFTIPARWSGADVRDTTGIASVDGTAYSGLFLTGDIALDTNPLILPNSAAQTLAVQAFFTFANNAFITAGAQSWGAFPGQTPLFSFGLLGGGIATGIFQRVPGFTDRYEHLSTIWQFNSANQVSPVPEPGTMVLLGTALAGVIAARRRQHKSTRM
jgi:hypothetical protein